MLILLGVFMFCLLFWFVVWWMSQMRESAFWNFVLWLLLWGFCFAVFYFGLAEATSYFFGIAETKDFDTLVSRLGQGGANRALAIIFFMQMGGIVGVFAIPTIIARIVWNRTNRRERGAQVVQVVQQGAESTPKDTGEAREKRRARPAQGGATR